MSSCWISSESIPDGVQLAVGDLEADAMADVDLARIEVDPQMAISPQAVQHVDRDPVAKPQELGKLAGRAGARLDSPQHDLLDRGQPVSDRDPGSDRHDIAR